MLELTSALITTATDDHIRFAECTGPWSMILWDRDIAEMQASLANKHFDLLVSFGAPKLPPEIIATADHALNLHGGNPEAYRGLDSHLWAILHNNFSAIQTTLHYLTDDFDAGDIVFREQLALPSRLTDLYACNVDACMRLVNLAKLSLRELNWLPRHQQKPGAYFSKLPAEYRRQCEYNYQQHLKALL